MSRLGQSAELELARQEAPLISSRGAAPTAAELQPPSRRVPNDDSTRPTPCPSVRWPPPIPAPSWKLKLERILSPLRGTELCRTIPSCSPVLGELPTDHHIFYKWFRRSLAVRRP